MEPAFLPGLRAPVYCTSTIPHGHAPPDLCISGRLLAAAGKLLGSIALPARRRHPITLAHAWRVATMALWQGALVQAVNTGGSNEAASTSPLQPP